MQRVNFKGWSLESIDEYFGTTQVDELDVLNELLAFEYNVDDFERRYLSMLSKDYLTLGGDNWNEVELENKIISPIIVFSGIQNKKFSYFLEREIEAQIDGFELFGRVDGMIATGFRSPKIPYFCLYEYKRQTDPNGDPQGQALIAMMVAQKLNNNQFPIYGCYVIGRNWYFMALVGKEYAISKDFSCVDDEMFDIFRILKSLRVQIEKII
jgi:hypothetical protein